MEAAQPPTQQPTKRVVVGDVVNETFSVYGQNFGVLLGSAIAVFLVVGLVAGILQSAGPALGLIGTALILAGQALYVGFVVQLVSDVRDGRRDQTVGDLFSAATPFILPLIGFGVLFGIGVTIGLVFLVVPGLILLTFWSVGAPAIVVERAGPIEAFGRSWRLVRGEAWSVFGALLVVLLIVIAIGVILAAISTPIGDGDAATWIASVISTTLTAPVFALTVSVLYFDLGGGGTPASSAATQQPPAAAQPPPAAQQPPPPPPPPTS